MKPMVKTLYKCYLGSTLGLRTVSILQAIQENYKWVFKKYGTRTDSISRFISKGEKINPKYFKGD